MSYLTYTENGALSYPNNDPMLNLFYRSVRNMPEENMRLAVKNAWYGISSSEEQTKNSKKDKDTFMPPLYRMLDVLRNLYYLRWCRGGKGERKLFEIGLKTLMEIPHGMVQVKANMALITEFGYWRDFFTIFSGTPLESDAVKIFAEQLTQDLAVLKSGKNLEQISLAGKWAPSEGKELDKKHNIVNKIVSELGINKHQYRKQYLAPLRRHLDVVETYMCESRWNEIQYQKLPSLAMIKYAKTFEKHDHLRYQEYLNAVKCGQIKMNIKIAFPHQITEKYLARCYNKEYPSDEALETMWEEMKRQVKKEFTEVGVNMNALAVADVSGSMYGTPLNVCVSLALFFAEIMEGQFANMFYTFSNNPQLVEIKGKNLMEKLTNILKAHWEMNTDIQKVFDDLLKHARIWKVPVENYPKMIYVFTDGQFDYMVKDSKNTNFEVIEKKHKDAGYPMPTLIFWNLLGDTIDFPVSPNQKNVALLSGFSPMLMKLILHGAELTPTRIMYNALEQPMLAKIQLRFPNNAENRRMIEEAHPQE